MQNIWNTHCDSATLARRQKVAELVQTADAVVIGAGSGLSSAAGLLYSGERFQNHFADFIAKYGLRDMYSAAFYPYENECEYWAYWARHIDLNRYTVTHTDLHAALLRLVADKDYFVITTNVDHLFQLNGFDKKRLFYTQGDYGLFQCSVPCHDSTYDNREVIKSMLGAQVDMRVPRDLIPHCPRCSAPITQNLRRDGSFVEDEGWHAAAERYQRFLSRHSGDKLLYLELGVGGNTPGIIKYPFWQLTHQNGNALYVCVSRDDAVCPKEIANRSLCIDGDISWVFGCD